MTSPTTETTSLTTAQLLSSALDEIYALREMIASEARILEAHTEYRTFPKSRRAIANASILRMRNMARGHAVTELALGKAPDGVYRFGKRELDNIGADGALTTESYEESLTSS